MNIIDPIRNKVGLGASRNTDTIGVVVKTPDELGDTKIGVYIPKFMLGYSMTKGELAKDTPVPVFGMKCINDLSNSKFWKSSITVKNYIVVYPYLNQNQSMPYYTIGDKVIIRMIDNDLKTLAFLPYSLNNLKQRAVDKCMFSVPANVEEDLDLTEENVYFFKMDSKLKTIVLSTAEQNGETSLHKFMIDGENGQVIITDDKDLSWTLDTKNDKIISKTSGSMITQEANNITLTGDNINLEVNDKLVVNTDVLELTASTIKGEANKAELNFSKYTLESDNGQFQIQKEKHSGMTFEHHHTAQLKQALKACGAAAAMYPSSPQGTATIMTTVYGM
jgi:hypothetical protein